MFHGFKIKNEPSFSEIGKGYIGGLYMFMSYLHDEEVVRSYFDEPIQYGIVPVDQLNLLS